MTIYAEEEAFGITQTSTEFLAVGVLHLNLPVKMVRLFLAGKHYNEPGDEHWVSFMDGENEVIVSGFGWGYRGLGPHGLHKALFMLTPCRITIDIIASLDIHKEYNIVCQGGDSAIDEVVR